MSTLNIRQIHNLAIALMKEHGLVDNGWTFAFDGAKTRAGHCTVSNNGKNKQITLSNILMTKWDESDVKNTILHEISHAIAYDDYGYLSHDRAWRSIAIRIGCDGKRCFGNEMETLEGQWVGICSACGRKRSFHRAPLRVRMCSDCSPYRFNPEFIYTWFKKGEIVSPAEMPERYQRELASINRRYSR